MAMSKCVLGVVVEERFRVDRDGVIYSPNGFGDLFWNRYLLVFDEVLVIARTRYVTSVDSSWAKVANPRVRISLITEYLGVGQFLRKCLTVRTQLLSACMQADFLLIRAPGTLALLVERSFRSTAIFKKPLAVELVGDPEDVFSAGIGGKIGMLLKSIFTKSTRQLCLRALAVQYVTKSTLQSKYPSCTNALTSSCSDVALAQKDFAILSRRYEPDIFISRVPLIFVAASLEVPYKGIDVLIKSVAFLREKGIDLSVRIAGDGRLRDYFVGLSAEYGVSGSIQFLGRLERQSVLNEMQVADIYIQPSLTEGLPRAVLEACAAALPVIATNVGGIPEIIDESMLVCPGDHVELAEKIAKALSSSECLTMMSKKNLLCSRDYEDSMLELTRQSFYQKFRLI